MTFSSEKSSKMDSEKERQKFLYDFRLICYVWCIETKHFITDLFLPPTADGAHHRGIALPKPVVWSKEKPGKDKPRMLPFSVHNSLTSKALLCPVPHSHTDLCFCHNPVMLYDFVCQREVMCLVVVCVVQNVVPVAYTWLRLKPYAGLILASTSTLQIIYSAAHVHL